MEQWRPIPGYAGYEASTEGRIRGTSGRIVTQTISNKRYRKISLYVDGCRYDKSAHRLIASAFHGEARPGLVCCHLNGDPADNRPNNLKWATPSENERHKPDRLTLDQIDKIASMRGAGSVDEIAALFSVSPETISRIYDCWTGLRHTVTIPSAESAR